MLKGVVRQPLLSNPIGTTMSGNAAMHSATANEPRQPPHQQREHHRQQHHQREHQRQHHAGKEKIHPLTRRPIHHRLDVYPFLIGYFTLLFLDAHYYHYAGATTTAATTAATIHDAQSMILATLHVDVAFVILLMGQLALFLKCQWDPIWHAKIAYRQYQFHPSTASDKEEEENCLVEKKIDDMKTWTHCLIIPPAPYDASNSNSNNGTAAGAKASQTIRPERPGIVPLEFKQSTIAGVGSNVSSSQEGAKKNGVITSFVAVIHFRGWTDPCRVNAQVVLSTGIMVEVKGGDDLPMESIWNYDGEEEDELLLEEVSDGEESEVSQSAATIKFNNTSTASTATTTTIARTTTWEPQFHRLHFPIDLPLQFYNQWQGHHSIPGPPSNNTSTTLQSTQQIYGLNQTIIPLPPFLSLLLTQQLLQPMFLFQLLCVMLWCLDEYWMYAVFTLFTLILFEAIQAGTRYKNVKRLREEVSGGASSSSSSDTAESEANGQMSATNKQRVECYRMGQWTFLPTSQLVVGDIISMVSPSVHNRQQQQRRNAVRNVHDHERGCAVPADLLLLSGRAVVNEAMLTGESVPQVKESIEVDGSNEIKGYATSLDLSDGSSHKRCVLFGGTVLMDHHSEHEGDDDHDGNSNNSAPLPDSNIPPPPDGGLACFVLRTGFDTVQGQLLRTLAHHAESGAGSNSAGGDGVDARETFLFLLLLLACALASAGTVVQHAWGDVTRNRFKLVLHVVIIITSVIPPELPMELSLAVTTSLGELIKQYHVYCTEPFRIPLAGLVDTCCFDKTGTLTSDELRLHGVRLPKVDVKGGAVDNGKDGDEDLILFDDILSRSKSPSVDDGVDADFGNAVRSLLPRETLRVMVGCQSLATTHVFVPGPGGRTMVQTELCGDPLEKAVMEGCGYTIHPKTELVMEKSGPTTGSTGPIKVLHRFAFSSKLRRMTVLALDAAEDGEGKNTLWALTKGAPEALEPMLDPKTLPADYEQSYLRHMTLGRRVLALAHRNLGKNTPDRLAKSKSSRDEVEQKLTFAGLLIMDSPLKTDSARVVKELRAGDQNVVMVTGDAVLTAAEVARRVGIVDAAQHFTYELLCRDDGDTKRDPNGYCFRPLDHSIGRTAHETEGDEIMHSTRPEMEAMVREGKANFCITGDTLTKLAVRAVERTTDSNQSNIDDRTVLNHPAARSALSEMAPFITVFARHAPRHKEAVVAALNSAGRRTLMCGDGTNDVGALKQAHIGVSIVSVPELEKKQRSADEEIDAVRAEEKRERKAAKKKKKRGDSSGKGGVAGEKKPKRNTRADRIERSLRALREAEEELDFVGLGNASVASPFTSRKTSVRCCKDILQQGRCTLVTMIQIYKILGVQCLVNALVLTKLHQKGVKQGDRQLTAVGVVVSVLFLFVTRGKPLPRLSPHKPPSSVMNTETLLSMAVQFGVHFAAIMAVTFISDVYVDPYDPSIVPDGPFHPNTLNTATFLVTVLATINAFLVNYRGRPFMEDLKDNKLLFKSIQGCYLVLFMCASEVFPPLNQLLQLSPLPTSGPPVFDSSEGVGGSVGHDEFDIIHDFLLRAVSLIGFRTMLCVIMCLDTALVTVAEKGVRSLLES